MNYEKLSPALALALEDFQSGGRPALSLHNDQLGLVSVEPDMPKPPRVVVFVHCEDNTAQDAFADLGVELNGAGGRIRTGIVPLASLDALTESEAVHRVVPARRLKALMDVAVPMVKVPTMWSHNLSGKGVVLGVVDTGVDVRNPAFEDRVLRIWDQTLPGPGVLEGGYGSELTGAHLQMSQDTIGHGTHVSGMAAGNDPVYTGVAPKATIVMVKSDLMTAHIADGVRYIFRVAKELRRPAVVNLSLGGHGDAHDGTDSLSLVIDAATGPGRIVCCAAGNEGNDNIHAQVQVKKGSTRTISCAVAVPTQGQPPPTATFNGWYDGADELEVAVVSPSGKQTPYQPIISTGSPTRTYQVPNGSVAVITPGPDPANGDVNFFVQIQPSVPTASTPKPHAWKIRLKGKKVSSGTVDVWSTDEGTAQFTGVAVKDDMKVGSPGCATSVVTVAAFTTKVEWDDFTGGHHETGEVLNTISDFSSEGPRRDAVEKPDVAAPGSVIACSLSSHSPITPALLIDPWNRINQGTSMACPFISGIVALLLQRDRKLDPHGAKDLLKKHSKIKGKPGGTWDAKWGYGLVDASGL